MDGRGNWCFTLSIFCVWITIHRLRWSHNCSETSLDLISILGEFSPCEQAYPRLPIICRIVSLSCPTYQRSGQVLHKHLCDLPNFAIPLPFNETFRKCSIIWRSRITNVNFWIPELNYVSRYDVQILFYGGIVRNFETQQNVQISNISEYLSFWIDNITIELTTIYSNLVTIK